MLLGCLLLCLALAALLTGLYLRLDHFHIYTFPLKFFTSLSLSLLTGLYLRLDHFRIHSCFNIYFYFHLLLSLVFYFHIHFLFLCLHPHVSFPDEIVTLFRDIILTNINGFIFRALQEKRASQVFNYLY